MNPSQLFSFRTYGNMVGNAFNRFPVTTILLSLTCLIAIIGIIDRSIFSNFWPLIWAGSLATVSTLVIYLWCELLQNQRMIIAWLTGAIILSLCDYLYITRAGDFSTGAEYIGRSALATALIIGIIFPPVAKGYSKKSTFIFSINQLSIICLSLALSIVLSISLSVILGTLSILFSWENIKFYGCIGVIFSIWIPALFYLFKIPRIQNDISDTTIPKIGNAVLYVLAPIAVIYIAILYVYGMKIFLTWDLPTSSISIMVSGLLCVVLVTIYGLQAFIFFPSSSPRTAIATIATRWLPLTLFPLMILMSVGVIFRINQYGITISRLYLSTFNIWAYVVVLYLTFRHREANLNAVAASFAIIFALVSIIPYYNYSNLALTHIYRSIYADLGEMPYPVSAESLKERIATLPKEKAESVLSRISYCYMMGSKEQIAKLTTETGYITDNTFDNSKKRSTNRAALDVRIQRFYPVDIPTGYSKIQQKTLNRQQWKHSTKTDDGTISIYNDSITVLVNIDSLIEQSKIPFRTLYVPASTTNDPNAIFAVESAYIDTIECNIQGMSGYLFTH